MTKNIRNQIGVVYVILSAILLGTMPLLALIAYAHGSNAYTVAFGRFFFGNIVLGAVTAFMPDCTVKISKSQFLTLVKLSIPYALMAPSRSFTP